MPDATTPLFGPSRQLDFELEMGCFVGPGNQLGEPVPVERAEERIFGLALVNDWSARDIQAWEYQPLGPFLAKSFCTSISPWVVTLEALEPFRVQGPAQEPAPLPYLRHDGPASFDIRLEALLQSARMGRPARIAASNFRHLYWSMAQQLAHHTQQRHQPGQQHECLHVVHVRLLISGHKKKRDLVTRPPGRTTKVSP